MITPVFSMCLFGVSLLKLWGLSIAEFQVARFLQRIDTLRSCWTKHAWIVSLSLSLIYNIAYIPVWSSLITVRTCCSFCCVLKSNGMIIYGRTQFAAFFPNKQNPRTAHKKTNIISIHKFHNKFSYVGYVIPNTHGTRRTERNLPNMHWDWNLPERRQYFPKSLPHWWLGNFSPSIASLPKPAFNWGKVCVFVSFPYKNTDPRTIKSPRSFFRVGNTNLGWLCFPTTQSFASPKPKIRGWPVSWKRCSTASANSSGKPMPTKPPGKMLDRAVGDSLTLGRIQIACMGQYLPFEVA